MHVIIIRGELVHAIKPHGSWCCHVYALVSLHPCTCVVHVVGSSCRFATCSVLGALVIMQSKARERWSCLLANGVRPC